MINAYPSLKAAEHTKHAQISDNITHDYAWVWNAQIRDFPLNTPVEPQLELEHRWWSNNVQKNWAGPNKQLLIISESHFCITITRPACPRKAEGKWEHSLTPGGFQIHNKVGAVGRGCSGPTFTCVNEENAVSRETWHILWRFVYT